MKSEWVVARSGSAPPLFLAGEAPLLRADEQVFEAMLEGWSEQQRSRGLRTETIDGRLLALRRFQRFTADWPWAWRPVDLEDFTSELRGDRKSLATVRSYQRALRQFRDYVADPRYEWSTVCDRMFGTHRIQICFALFAYPTAVAADQLECHGCCGTSTRGGS